MRHVVPDFLDDRDGVGGRRRRRRHRTGCRPETWRNRHVKLTPEGIDIANIVSTKYVDWDDMVDVKDNTDTKRRTRRAIVLCLRTVARRS